MQKKVIVPQDLKPLLEKNNGLFKRSDIKLFPAATNRKALSLHRAKKADLIIAKLDAPDMSGEMLCSLIREDDELRDVSIIIVCSGSDADLDRCARCRANAFLTTPIDTPVLEEEVLPLLHVAARTACRVPLSIEFEGASKKTPFIGYIENISTSGMLFRSAAYLFEGDAVTCSFALSGSKRITASGEIIRALPKQSDHDTYGYGVKFTDLGASAFSAIEAFLRKTGAREASLSGPKASTY